MPLHPYKRWLPVIALLIAVLPDIGYGGLVWESKRIELTAKPAEKQITGIYHFKNAGNTTISITSVKPSCGCTTAELTKETYAPEETGEIKAVFTVGDRVGQQDKIIQVVTDDAPNEPIQLSLRINIPQLINCTPRLLLWRIGEAVKEKSIIITSAYAQKLSSIELKGAESAEATVRIVPAESGTESRLFILPRSTAKAAQVALPCIAKFADGTTHAFTVYALIR